MRNLRIKRVPLAYVTEVVEKAEPREIDPSSKRSSGKVATVRTPNRTKNVKSQATAIIRSTKIVAEGV
jgi:hypothetical protein